MISQGQFSYAPQAKHMRKLWLLAWPLIISNISVPLLGLVDAAVMGHLDHASYLGAVALGATLLSFIYWAFGFLRMGTVGLTAQAHGAKNNQRLMQLLLMPGLLALAIGLGIVDAARLAYPYEACPLWAQAPKCLFWRKNTLPSASIVRLRCSSHTSAWVGC